MTTPEGYVPQEEEGQREVATQYLTPLQSHTVGHYIINICWEIYCLYFGKLWVSFMESIVLQLTRTRGRILSFSFLLLRMSNSSCPSCARQTRG